MEKILLRLQGFLFTVEYCRGIENPTDYMSRYLLPSSRCTNLELERSYELETHVRWVTNNSLLTSVTIGDIKKATQTDVVLQTLAECIYVGVLKLANHPKLTAYKGVFEELSVVNDMVLRGSRMLM